MQCHGIRWSLVIAAVFPGILAAQAPDKGIETTVSHAIDVWSSDHATVVTQDARYELLQDAQTAVTETIQQQPELKSSDVAKSVPSAVAAFLTESQNNASSATLTQILQEHLTGIGQVLPQLSNYPTLSVDISPPRPPNFVVSIDGITYPAGSRLFRVRTGRAQVRVARSGRRDCERSITVTQSGPNVVSCRL